MYLNAQSTFNELLDMGIIPIVNENDTISVSEIKFGDNDTLSAITAAMVHADMLFLMTDVDCLYDKNPRTNPDAQPIEVIDDIDALEADGRFPPGFPSPSSPLLGALGDWHKHYQEGMLTRLQYPPLALHSGLEA